MKERLISCGAVYYAVQVGTDFRVFGSNLEG